MKFTIAPLALENLIKTACTARPKRKDNLTITATGNRLMVECNGTGSATDATVSAEGAFTVHAQTFRKVLDTYKGTPSLEFEANAEGLRIKTFRMPVLAYNPSPKPPANTEPS
jgi:DNA polymerase III sliding clamp (beta) subunit (PCNA family)